MSKRTCWIATAAAAVAFPGFALAQDTPPPPPAAPDRTAELFTRYDANTDGKITHDEVAAVAQKTITDGDANADGVLTVDEHQAAQSSTRFKAFDKNGDGSVSLEEFQQQPPQGGRGRGFGGGRDQDGDGALSVEELSGMMNRMFEMADADQNGELTQAELAQTPMGGRGGRGGGGGGEGRGPGGGEGGGGGGEGRPRPAPEELFQRLDTDANGSLSQAELDAMRGPGGGRRGGRGGQQGGGGQEPESGKVY